ncbi:MAG: GntR family transcriptional regulator [Butyricicoccus pullicaecorum]|nr:GntR family transcriptional regulator [Butyricicoccus pullicaecorum]
MNLIIRNTSGQPLYDQITAQIKALILSGELRAGDMLPSMRALAKDLRISVITTKRAYDELEREGFVETVPGKGCFVAQANIELIQEENLKQIENHLNCCLNLAEQAGISVDELHEMLNLLAKGE